MSEENMNTLILINKGEGGSPIRSMRRGAPSGKYSDIATLFTPRPKVGIARDLWKYKIEDLNKFDVLIFELTFYNTWQRHFIEIADKVTAKTLLWTGAVDRFLRFVKPESLGELTRGLELVDYIGTLNGEDVKTWKVWAPQAHVFHLPIWYDIPEQQSLFPGNISPDSNFVLLCVHTSLWLDDHARRGDVQSIVIYKRLKEMYPELRGLTFMMRRHREFHEKTQGTIQEMGINDLEVCPHSSLWYQFMAQAFCSIDMTQTKIMGKWSIHHAIAGTPIISTDVSDAQRRLFPDLTVSWWDAEGAIEKYVALREGKFDRENIVEKAKKALPFFSRKSALKRIRREMEVEI